MYMEGETDVEVRRSPQAVDVTLHTGLVHFTVRHDPHRPFRVTTPDARVVDVGTQFSVAREDGRTSVVVFQGVVDVTDLKAPDAPPSQLSERSKIILGGASRDPASQSAATAPNILQMLHASIEEWAYAFNRTSVTTNFVVQGAAAHRRLGGTINLNDPEKLIRQIRSSKDNPPLVIERDGAFVIIREKDSR